MRADPRRPLSHRHWEPHLDAVQLLAKCHWKTFYGNARLVGADIRERRKHLLPLADVGLVVKAQDKLSTHPPRDDISRGSEYSRNRES